MEGELHLPDLPEVPVGLRQPAPPPGGPDRRGRGGWPSRLRELMAGYLPLVLMTLLALGTWLVAKNTPGAFTPAPAGTARHVPDYTVDHFTLQRFDATGALKVELEGDRMRHYPDVGMMEVDRIHIVSTDAAGERTTASALQGRARDDNSEIWLDGHAQVLIEKPGEAPIHVDGEHLRAWPKTRIVESDAPVVVRQGDSEFRADGMRYDQAARLLTLRGKTHALLQPSLRQSAARKPAP